MRTWLLFIVTSLLFSSGSFTAQEDLALPPIELVRELRQARIAHLEGNSDRQQQLLRQAIEDYPTEIAPVYALLEYDRHSPLADAETTQLYQHLAHRLGDPRGQLPLAVMTQIAADRDANQRTLRILADHLEQAVAGSDRAQPRTLALLANVQDRLGEPEKGLKTLEALYQFEPSPGLEFSLYRLYTHFERWQDARKMIARLAADDNTGYYRSAYVRILAKAGDFEEHARQLDKLVEQRRLDDSDVVWTLRQAGWDLRDAGSDERAQQVFRQALEIEPDDGELQSVMRFFYASDAERLAFAAAEGERWQDEEDPRTLFDEGTERLTSGDAEAAFDLLSRAAPGLPDLEAAWFNLGMAAYRLERWDVVESAFAQAAVLNTERSGAFFYRGLALEKLERCADAVPALKTALELDPERHIAHYYLATCHAALGQSEASQRHRALYDASSN